VEKELIIAIVLGVLVLVVVAQSLQLNALNASLSSVKAGQFGSAALQSGSITSAAQPVPSAQPSAPRQVGGC